MVGGSGAKKNEASVARHAEQPGQTVNVDLCFVPWTHAAEAWLPAVSGSSGHLVIGHPPRSAQVAVWPGQRLQQSEVPYEQAMYAYAQATRERLVRQKSAPPLAEPEASAWRQAWEARAARHAVLQHRRQADTAWRAARQAHHQAVDAYRALPRRQRAAQLTLWQAQKAHWAQREADRQTLLAARKTENLHWHQTNRLRRHASPQVWIAILVISDNATRQCLGLPVFASGAKITAQEVVSALRALLPPQLAFLISDQGTHFRSMCLAQLAKEADFVQVPIYRHRPQSNGIAERFVLTLKQALCRLSWDGPDALRDHLADFRPAYNDRPHQGLAIPGLSPNELALRTYLF